MLNIFLVEHNILENEKRYDVLKRTILGDDQYEDEDNEEEGGNEDGDEDNDIKINDETDKNHVDL